MKKYTSLILCCTLLSFGQIQKAHATAAIGATFPQQIIEDVSLVSSAGTNSVTAISTTANTIKNTIAGPLATQLINMAQQQAANDILRWANGGFNGTPLIVGNPEKFLKQAALNSSKAITDSIPKGTILGDSIFGTLYKNNKNVSTKSKLTALTQSNVPSIMYNNICLTDAKLTSFATKEVMNRNGTVNQAELVAKKQQLYNSLCKGDPNTDQALANRLIAVSKQRQDIGGWDLWLNTTVAGDNAYTKSVRAADINAAEQAASTQRAHDELYLGQKPKSQTKCTEYITQNVTDTKGNITAGSKVCAPGKEITVTPGSTVSSAIEKAANSGIDRLTNLGSDGLMGLVATIAIQKLTTGINQAIVSTVNDALSGSDSNSGTTVSKTVTYKQDLAGDAEAKTGTLSPMLKQLKYYNEQLDKLRETDTAYIALVNGYASRISQDKNCFDNLVSEGIATADDSQIVRAYTFYRGRQSKIDELKNLLTPELGVIGDAKKLVEDTRVGISNSNSTQEISKIFAAYTNTIDTKGYPDMQTEGTRRTSMNKDSHDVDSDFKDIPNNSEVKENAKTYQNLCNQIRSSRNYNGGWGN